MSAHPFYERLRGELNQWLASGHSPSSVAVAVAAVGRQEDAIDLPEEAGLRDLVMRLTWLLFLRAPKLDPLQIAFVPMHLERIREGREGWDELLGSIEAKEDAQTVGALDHVLTLHGDDLATWLGVQLSGGRRIRDRIDQAVEEMEDRARQAILEGRWNDVPAVGPDAARVRESLSRLEPRTAARVWALWQKGAEAAEAGKLRQAVVALEQAIEEAPDVFESYVRRASYRFARADTDTALQDVEQALTLCPEATNARAMRAELRMRLDDIPGALADWDAVVAADPLHLPFRIGRSHTLITAGQFDAALTDLDEAARQSPDDPAPWFNRAGLRFRRGDLVGGIEDLDRVLELRPEEVRARLHRGAARMMQRDAEAALVDFEEAVRLQPGDPACYAQRAGALISCGRLVEGWVDALTALALAPDDWGQRGHALEIARVALQHLRGHDLDGRPMSDRFELIARQAGGAAAARLADQLDALRPSDHPGWFELCARAWLANGQLDKAVRAFQQMVTAAPNAGLGFLGLGQALLASNRALEAMTALERARALEDSLEADARFELYLLRGRALGTLGHLQAAVAAFDAALGIDQARADVWFYRGVHLDLQQDRRGAEISYGRAIACDETFAAAWYNRACERAVLGEVDGALSDLERAVRLDPNFAAEAGRDDYLAGVRSDPRFKAIVG